MNNSELILRMLAERVVHRAASLLGSLLTEPLVTRAAGAIFVLFIALVAAAPFVHPPYNWDLAPYLAVALEEDIPDPEQLHEKVWGMMKAGATEDQFRDLTTDNSYRMAQYANADVFYSQLVFYRVKIAYTALIRELGQIIGYVEATQLINTLSAIAIGAILILWMRHGQMMQAALVVGPVMLLGGFLIMAQLAMPDLFGSALVVMGVYMTRLGKDWWAVAFLFTAFLARTDVIVFLFALIIAALTFRSRVLPALVAFVMALAISGPLYDQAGHPGWWAHYYFTNVEIQDDMRGFDPEFSLAAYFVGLARGIVNSFRFNNWLTLFALLILGWLALFRAGKVPGEGVISTLIAAQVLCIVGKFVLFPLFDGRVYFPHLLPLAMLLLELWKPRFDLENAPTVASGPVRQAKQSR